MKNYSELFASAQLIRDTFSAMRNGGKMRHREIAEHIHLSEGELIAAHIGVPKKNSREILHATRLRHEWPEIVSSLVWLGEVMALTRNTSCVHEVIGTYRNISHHNQVGLVLGSEIDLRIFYKQWAHGFGVVEQTEQGPQRSLQFFNAQGVALHKVFLKLRSSVEAYDSLVQNYADENQRAGLCTVSATPRTAELPDSTIDVEGLQSGWDALRDTHDFFDLLNTYSVTRTQALRLADSTFVHQVKPEDCYRILSAVATAAVPVMVFVGNPGVIQIHTGRVNNISVMGTWLNVLDTGFSLHLRVDQIASAWIVKKPTLDGLVTSLELFDSSGDTIAMFFGERKPGKHELCEWRAVIENVLLERRACLA